MSDKAILLHVGPTGHQSWLEVDGERVDNIKSVEIKVEAGELTECTVVMLAKAMRVEIEPEVWEKATGEADT